MNMTLIGRTSDHNAHLANPGGKTVRKWFTIIGKEEYCDGTIKIDGVSATPDTVVPATAKTVLSAQQLKGNK